MYTKRQIQQMLQVNGLTPTSSNDELKKVLSRVPCDSFDSLVSRLRDEKVEAGADICGLEVSSATKSNILTAETRLKPDSIKHLLGIDVEINYADLEHARVSRKSVSFLQMFGILFWSVVCALLMIAGVMWHFEIGYFHPSF